MNQHYVCRRYLRKFCSTGEKIFVFDKQKREVRETNIKNVASEQDFYGSKDIEDKHSRIESETYPAIEELLHGIMNENRIDLSELEFRLTLARFVAYQECRTSDFRYSLNTGEKEFHRRVVKKHNFAIAHLKSQGHQIAAASYIDETVPDFAEADHDDLIFGDYLDRAANILANQIMAVGQNNTDMPFYTSDAPVLRYQHGPANPYGGIGLASPCAEITMPISPKHVLSMFDRASFQAYAEKDGKVFDLPLQNVVGRNMLQIQDSRRQIFCSENKFELVRHAENLNPDFFELNRSKMSSG